MKTTIGRWNKAKVVVFTFKDVVKGGGEGLEGYRTRSLCPSSDRLTPEQLGIHSAVFVSSCHIPCCQ